MQQEQTGKIGKQLFRNWELNFKRNHEKQAMLSHMEMKEPHLLRIPLLYSSNVGKQIALPSVHVTGCSWKASVIEKAM